MCSSLRPSLPIVVAAKPEPRNAPTAQPVVVRLARIGEYPRPSCRNRPMDREKPTIEPKNTITNTTPEA